jgi:hypothetical protein
LWLFYTVQVKLLLNSKLVLRQGKTTLGTHAGPKATLKALPPHASSSLVSNATTFTNQTPQHTHNSVAFGQLPDGLVTAKCVMFHRDSNNAFILNTTSPALIRLSQRQSRSVP